LFSEDFYRRHRVRITLTNLPKDIRPVERS
jgi:hypothetical protein